MSLPQAFDLALQHHRAGRLADAEALYRQILAAQPNHADAVHLLGLIAHQVGRHDTAVEWIRRAITLNPKNFLAHSNLGETYRATGRLDEAVAAHGRALQLKPDYAEGYNNLGIALRDQGQLGEAIANFHRAIELKSDSPEAHNNLGNALRELGRLDEAVAAFQRALELKPGYPEACNSLGNALKDQARLDEAIAAYRRALQLRPEDAGNHSNLVYALHLHPNHDYHTIAAEQYRWNRQFGDPLKSAIQPHTNDPTVARRLRIGYVSPDFYDHVVGRNLVPLFEHHDHRQFEIFCYSGVAQPDEVTDSIRRRAHHWRSTLGVGDEALAEMIRRDGVDILVDLAQHTRGNRLPLFARKPAPVQVSFAGYPESTGLETIEYRISDRHLDSRTAHDATGRTEHVCLIDSFWCYDPCGMEVEVNELPATGAGRVTFGCLNNFCKINEPALKLWARVLGQVTNSRLALLSRVGSHRQWVSRTLEREGIEARRVEFLDFRPRREYLELYHRLDIVLDIFPYNGHTTSLDALWMGVPVVTLAGATAVSRAGLSQLTNLGLPELVARSETEYVNIAERLARDLPRLAELRTTLRARMRASPLMDAPRFARSVEAAYRFMWQRWSLGNSPARND